jgi:hypothetical protein
MIGLGAPAAVRRDRDCDGGGNVQVRFGHEVNPFVSLQAMM